jgi:hypothetical protein
MLQKFQTRLKRMNPEICDFLVVRIASTADMMAVIHGS